MFDMCIVQRFDMCIEFEVRIEGHSQYIGVPFQGQYGVAQSDLWMDVRLRKLRGE